MKSKIYGNDISPKCEYCEFGEAVKGGEEILCVKKGVMRPDFFCKKFKYSPLKRTPKTLKVSSDFSAEDFSL